MSLKYISAYQLTLYDNKFQLANRFFLIYLWNITCKNSL